MPTSDFSDQVDEKHKHGLCLRHWSLISRNYKDNQMGRFSVHIDFLHVHMHKHAHTGTSKGDLCRCLSARHLVGRALWESCSQPCVAQAEIHQHSPNRGRTRTLSQAKGAVSTLYCL